MVRGTMLTVVLALVNVPFAAMGAASAGSGGGGIADKGSAIDQFLLGGAKGTSDVAGAVLGYFGNRFLDLLDIVELDVGFGLGLKAGVEYGVGRTTVGMVESQRFGLDSRQVGTWFEQNASFGIFPASLLFAPFELVRDADEPWHSLAVIGFEMGSLGAERTTRKAFATNCILYREAEMAGPIHQRPGDIAAVGGEVHLLIVGARTRIKPLEIVDFVLGFVGIDLNPVLAHPQGQDGGPGVEMTRPETIRRPGGQ